MRLNLAGWIPPFYRPVPQAAVTQAEHAVRTQPGVTLLPPTFEVVQFEGESFRSITGADGPRKAKANLAFHFTEFLPRMREFADDPATPAELAEWNKAAEQVEASPGPDFEVLGHRYGIVRFSRMLRLGRDGPESQRPCDQEICGYPGPP
jgi:hypothetical protein